MSLKLKFDLKLGSFFRRNMHRVCHMPPNIFLWRKALKILFFFLSVSQGCVRCYFQFAKTQEFQLVSSLCCPVKTSSSHNFFHISQHGRQWFTFQMMVKVGVVAIIQHAMTNVNFSLVLGAKSRHSNYDIKILLVV